MLTSTDVLHVEVLPGFTTLSVHFLNGLSMSARVKPGNEATSAAALGASVLGLPSGTPVCNCPSVFQVPNIVL